jgi:hypothetical protein
MPGWWRRLLEAARSAPRAEAEGWPNHHHDLRRRVAEAAERLPSGLVCALEGRYLPHGGRDEVWITITGDGGTVRRVRTPYRGAPVDALRSLGPGDARSVVETLNELGVWSLGPCRRSSIDGWPCAVAIADGARRHSIQTHNPDGPHLRLIGYLLSLVDAP